MFNFFDHDNGFTKSGLASPTKQSMGLELYICSESSYGGLGNRSGGGGGGVPSGTASFTDIQNVHGGSNPISLSEYYGVDTGVPASGTISVDDLRGTAAFPTSALSLFIDPGNTDCYSGSGTTINDLSDTQTSSLTLVGGTYSSSNGGYFDMSGSGSHMKLNSKTNIDRVVKRYTWHMFIRPDSAANTSLISCGEALTPAALQVLVNSLSRPLLYTTDDSGGFSGTATGYQSATATSTVISNSTWQHIAVVSETIGSCGFARWVLYKNGSSTQTINKDAQSNAPSGKDYVLFAQADTSFNYAFDGRVGVVLYYSDSQSSTEVGEVYDAFKSRYGLT
ncbi:hypothetical protein SCREM2_gp86 [Synechococcus phage S-CREM2]|nr:hypothetical protein SCREM2_gp86 [Synechococcus phage S-CREM2]